MDEFLTEVTALVGMVWIFAILISAPAGVVLGMFVIWQRTESIVFGGTLGLVLGLTAAPAALLCGLFFPIGVLLVLTTLGISWLLSKKQPLLTAVEIAVVVVVPLIWVAGLAVFGLGWFSGDAMLKAGLLATTFGAFVVLLVDLARFFWLTPRNPLRQL